MNHSTACCEWVWICMFNAKYFTFTFVSLFFWRWRRMSLKVFWSDKPSLSDQPMLDIVLRSNYLWAKISNVSRTDGYKMHQNTFNKVPTLWTRKYTWKINPMHQNQWNQYIARFGLVHKNRISSKLFEIFAHMAIMITMMVMIKCSIPTRCVHPHGCLRSVNLISDGDNVTCYWLCLVTSGKILHEVINYIN